MNTSEAKSRGQCVADFLAGSWRTEQGAVTVSPANLDLLTSWLYNSGSAGLAWWRIHDCKLRDCPSGELLHQGYRLQALQSAIQEERISIAFGLLREAGIEPILVKGWAAARSYAHRTLRAYGDIDLVVRPRDYSAAREAFEQSGTATWWIDLHQGLTELDDVSVDDLFKRSRLETHNDVPVRILSEEDHLALLAMHFFKHGAWRPSGLCDVAAIVELLPENFDWSLCLGSSKQRKAWIASALVMAEQLLGANTEQVPETLRSHKIPSWLLEAVLMRWGSLLPEDRVDPGSPALCLSIRCEIQRPWFESSANVGRIQSSLPLIWAGSQTTGRVFLTSSAPLPRARDNFCLTTCA